MKKNNKLKKIRQGVIVVLLWLFCGHSFFVVCAEDDREIDYFQIKKSQEQRVDESYERFKKDSTLNDSLDKWQDNVGYRAQAKAYYNIGNILFEEGRYDEAVEYYKKAIEHNPQEQDAYFNLGVLYGCFLHDNTKAVEYFTMYLEVAPDADDAPYVRNRIAQIRIRTKAAIYESVRTLSPGKDFR